MNSLWGGVEQPSQQTPGGGVSTPPNRGSSEIHDWGGVHKITGVHGPPQGGCRKHPEATHIVYKRYAINFHLLNYLYLGVGLRN